MSQVLLKAFARRALFAFAALTVSAASAQTWPARPVRIVSGRETLFPDITAPAAAPMPEAEPRSPFTTSEVPAAETSH